MPEASVDEQRKPFSCEGNIDCPARLSRNRIMHAVSMPGGVEAST